MKFIFWLLRKLERFKCPWHKLSDFFAILGLGALQKEEQNKNLHKPPDSQLPPPRLFQNVPWIVTQEVWMGPIMILQTL